MNSDAGFSKNLKASKNAEIPKTIGIPDIGVGGAVASPRVFEYSDKFCLIFGHFFCKYYIFWYFCSHYPGKMRASLSAKHLSHTLMPKTYKHLRLHQFLLVVIKRVLYSLFKIIPLLQSGEGDQLTINIVNTSSGNSQLEQQVKKRN